MSINWRWSSLLRRAKSVLLADADGLAVEVATLNEALDVEQPGYRVAAPTPDQIAAWVSPDHLFTGQSRVRISMGDVGPVSQRTAAGRYSSPAQLLIVVETTINQLVPAPSDGVEISREEALLFTGLDLAEMVWRVLVRRNAGIEGAVGIIYEDTTNALVDVHWFGDNTQENENAEDIDVFGVRTVLSFTLMQEKGVVQ